MSIPFSPESIPPGTEVGSYVIGRKLGMGNGGVVYEATSREGNLFALKVSRYRPGVPGSKDWVMEERFRRELLCHQYLLDHANVVKLYELGRYPDALSGSLYLVMEHVPGAETITRWARRRSPPLKEIIPAFKQLALVCWDMHTAGIRHRDIKPGNILVTPGGVPKLADFNSATCRYAQEVTAPAASALPCTPAYFPPELCKEALEEGLSGFQESFIYRPTADLYALGVVFYEVLTGRHPFNLELEGKALLMEILMSEPVPVRELNPGVPAELEDTVNMLLRRDPRKRFQTGRTLASELDWLLTSGKCERTPFRVPPEEQEPRYKPCKAPQWGEAQALPPAEPIAALARVADPAAPWWSFVALTGALMVATLAFASWYVAHLAVPAPSSPLQGPAVSSLCAPEKSIAPAAPFPPPSAAVAAGPVHRRRDVVATPPSGALPLSLADDKKTRDPLTAPPAERQTAEAVRVSPDSDEATGTLRAEIAGVQTASYVKVSGEVLSVDHALAALLAQGRMDLTPFRIRDTWRLHEDGADVAVSILTPKKETSEADEGKVAVVLNVTNRNLALPWRLQEVRLTTATGERPWPFAVRSDGESISRGRSGTVAIVMDLSTFDRTKAGEEIVLDVLRTGGHRQVSTALAVRELVDR